MPILTIPDHRIGAACSLQLAERGVHLALTYSSNVTAITALRDEIKKSSPELRISIHQVDVASAEQIEKMFTEIDKEHGQRPDILLSNAGRGKRITQVWDISLEEFDYTINVNLRASFILVKGVVNHMKEQRWGRIVFMSSIAGYGGGINGCRTLHLLFWIPTYINGDLWLWFRLRSFQRRYVRHDAQFVHPFGRIQHQRQRRGSGDDRRNGYDPECRCHPRGRGRYSVGQAGGT
jgi:NAD(P)-dependent dehydrogenase (short-subunit alcohol dehydrogenase family)